MVNLQGPTLPTRRTETFGDAARFIEYRIWVRTRYGAAFVHYDEGDTVRTEHGDIGTVDSFMYFPHTGMYAIHVIFGSKMKCYSDVYALEKVSVAEQGQQDAVGAGSLER